MTFAFDRPFVARALRLAAVAAFAVALAAPAAPAQEGGLGGFFQHLFGGGQPAKPPDAAASKPKKKVRDFVPATDDPRARHAGRRGGAADLLHRRHRRQPRLAHRRRPDRGLRRQAGDRRRRQVARRLRPGARRLFRLAEGRPRSRDRQGPYRLRRRHGRHQRSAGDARRRRQPRPAERSLEGGLFRAHRRGARAVPGREYSGRLGRHAADAHRPLQRRHRQAQRDRPRGSREAGRQIHRHLGRLRRPERAVRRLRPQRRRADRQAARPRRHPFHQGRRTQGRPFPRGGDPPRLRQGAAAERAPPTCRPTSSRRRATSTPRFAARWGPPRGRARRRRWSRPNPSPGRSCR